MADGGGEQLAAPSFDSFHVVLAALLGVER